MYYFKNRIFYGKGRSLQNTFIQMAQRQAFFAVCALCRTAVFFYKQAGKGNQLICKREHKNHAGNAETCMEHGNSHAVNSCLPILGHKPEEGV